MTKRKSSIELANTVRKKRQAFGVPKDAATKAKIKHNSMNSPLLALPLEIRKIIWTKVLGDQLLHVELRHYGGSSWARDYSDSDDDDLYEWNTIRCLGTRSLQELYESSKTSDNLCRTEFAHEKCTTLLCVTFPSRQDLLRYSVEDKEALLRYRAEDEKVRLEHSHSMKLLTICRQVYLEAFPILWSTNTFSFSDPKSFEAFMKKRNSFQKSLLSSLHLCMEFVVGYRNHWYPSLTIGMVKSLKGLKTLHLYLEQGSVDYVDPAQDDKAYQTTQVFQDAILETITNFKVLPLETVTVVIENKASLSLIPLPQAERLAWAERTRERILDPEGPLRWQERQDQIKELRLRELEDEAARKRTKTCVAASNDAECAERRQKKQDAADETAGRVRKVKKIAGPCGAKHICLICRRRGGYSAAYECTRPGLCDVDLKDDQASETADVLLHAADEDRLRKGTTAHDNAAAKAKASKKKATATPPDQPMPC